MPGRQGFRLNHCSQMLTATLPMGGQSRRLFRGVVIQVTLEIKLRWYRGEGESLSEEQMTNLIRSTNDIAPRRGFFRRVGGAVALGLAAFAPKPLYAQTKAEDGDGANWPGTLPGRHRQVVDAFAMNDGFPLAFAWTFLVPNESATAVVVLRHGAFPIALDHAMWEKYKIGESFKITDPETKAPAVKNPFRRFCH